jgi:putative tryptophan/tyrosine transport system substrate-binding protein
MKRRAMLGMLAAGASLPLATLGAANLYRLYMVTWRGMTDSESGFKDYLARRSIAVDYTWRDARQDPSRLVEFSREIATHRPDLVYTWGTSATLGIAGTLKQPAPSIATIPLVFTIVSDPVGAGIVGSLKQPGRDVTGVTHVASVAAQLEAMRAYLPFTTLGVLFNPAESNSATTVRELHAESQRGRFKLVEAAFALGADGRPLPDGIEARVASLRAAGAQWLYLGPDTYLFTQIARVAAAAKKERLPTFATTESYLEGEAPVLAGLVCRFRQAGEFAAFKAEQILVGKKKARDIPVETLARFSFVVRMDVAKALGILPPITLFNYADLR